MDPSILLGAKGIEAPNPLAMAGQGATLAELLTRVQQGQLQLEQTRQQAGMWADPRMAAMLGMGGPAGAQGGAPGQPQGPSDGSDNAQSQADLLRSFPLAAPGALKALTDLQKTQAEIGEARAKAGKAVQETKEIALTRFGNAAAALAAQDGPVTPMQASTLIAQAKSLNTPPDLLTTMPNIMDQGNLKQWLAGVGNAAATPEQQANIWKVKTVTPAEVARDTAAAGLSNTTAALMPQQRNAETTQAGAAAMNAGTNRANLLFGKTEVNPINGQVYQVAPQSAANPVAQVTQASAPGGAEAPQVGLTSTQGAQAAALKPRLEAINNNTELGQRILQIAPNLRALISSGYNGPIAGSDAGKAVLNTLASTGMLSADQVAKFGAMRASDAAVAEMMGPLAKELSTRGSNMTLNIVSNAKAGSNNAGPIRDRMIDAAVADATNLVNYGKGFNDYITKNPADLSATGFVPPPTVGLPTKQRVEGSLPPPSRVPLGTVATGDDGSKWQNVIDAKGQRNWVRQ